MENFSSKTQTFGMQPIPNLGLNFGTYVYKHLTKVKLSLFLIKHHIMKT